MWIINTIFIFIIIKLLCNNFVLQKSYKDDFSEKEKLKIRECLYNELNKQLILQNDEKIKDTKHLLAKWDIISEYNNKS